METLIATLMVWISIHTDYSIREIPTPDVQLLTSQEMTQEYYSGTDVPLPESGEDSRILALYNSVDTDNGTVFLLDPRLNRELIVESAESDAALTDLSLPLHREWLDNPVFQEQLLHELIHHVQFHSGVSERYPCPAFGEKEAYLLGGKYLRLRHARDPLPNRQVLAHMFSRC